MSAWRIGAGTDDVANVRQAGNTLKRYIDKITLWIPGDVVVIYVAGVTALLTQSNEPNVVWLVVMAVVTLMYVPFAAWVARKEITGAVWGRALLAVWHSSSGASQCRKAVGTSWKPWPRTPGGSRSLPP